MSQVLEFAAGFVKNVPENFPAEVMQDFIEHPEKYRMLYDSLRPAPKVEIVSEREWDVWKWIDLGMSDLRSGEAFLKDFASDSTNVGSWAKDILLVKGEEGKPLFTVAAEPIRLPLVKVTVAELGFTRWTRYDKICARAIELGLNLCPPEVGPQLRRQYRDQPLGEWIVIAMKAIPDSGGALRVFGVERDGDGLWLSCCFGYPCYEFTPDNQLVFVPRKYQKKPLVA